MAFEEINNGNYPSDPSAGTIFEAFEKVNRNFVKTVEREVGKGLSTEDFTTNHKTKLESSKTVSSGAIAGTDLVLTMDDFSTVTVDASELKCVVTAAVLSGGNNPVLTLSQSQGANVAVDLTPLVNTSVVSSQLQNNILTLTKTDGSTIVTDLSVLATDTKIASGNVSGTDLVLTHSDTSTVTIDMSAFDASGLTNLVDDTTPELGGNLDGNGHTISNVSLSNVDLKSLADNLQQPTVAATTTLDFAESNAALVDLNQTTNIQFANPPVAGNLGSMTVIFKQDSTGSRTPVLPASVIRGSLDMSTEPYAQTICEFTTTDGGVSYTAVTKYREGGSPTILPATPLVPGILDFTHANLDRGFEFTAENMVGTTTSGTWIDKSAKGNNFSYSYQNVTTGPDSGTIDAVYNITHSSQSKARADNQAFDTSNFGCSFWALTPELAEHGFAAFRDAGAGGFEHSMDVYVDTGRKIVFRGFKALDDSETLLRSNNTYFSKWIHIYVEVNASIPRMVINGTDLVVGTEAINTATLVDFLINSKMGVSSIGDFSIANIRTAQYRLFDRPLTDGEVLTLANEYTIADPTVPLNVNTHSDIWSVWRFEAADHMNDAYFDHSTNGNNLNRIGSVFNATGPDGSSNAWDGFKNDPDNVRLELLNTTLDTNNFALSIWVEVYAVGASDQPIAGFGNSNAATTNTAFDLGWDTGMKFYLRGWQNDGTEIKIRSNDVHAAGWHHVYIEVRNGVMKMIVGGTDTVSDSTVVQGSTATNIYLATGVNSDNTLYNYRINSAYVRLDDAYVFSAPLQLSDVVSLANEH